MAEITPVRGKLSNVFQFSFEFGYTLFQRSSGGFWAARLPALLGLAPDAIASLGAECVGEGFNPS